MSGAKKLKYRKVVASTQLWQGAGQHGQGQWACPDPLPYPREKGTLLPKWYHSTPYITHSHGGHPLTRALQ